MNQALFSSKSVEWETPPELFRALDEEFGFTLDVCASEENKKCEKFFSRAEDGLKQKWSGVCWCNPPYGREVGTWVAKAAKEAGARTTVVMLLPARTDTKWFHGYIYGQAEVRFLPGRLKFGGSKNGAPFPSMIVIFRGVQKNDT